MILLVEDDPGLRESLTDILNFAELEVTPVSDAPEALQVLHSSDELPKLIVSDIKMPGMDGISLLEAVKSNVPEDIPFLFVTGLNITTNTTNSPEQGVVGYLHKPFDVDELLNIVSDVLN